MTGSTMPLAAQFSSHPVHRATDLLRQARLSAEDERLLREIEKEDEGAGDGAPRLREGEPLLQKQDG